MPEQIAKRLNDYIKQENLSPEESGLKEGGKSAFGALKVFLSFSQ